MQADIAEPLARFAVPIDSVRSYPDNPRIGSVDIIETSLIHHGQYRPIVVQQSTGYILKGNHTWMAAKRLGWDHVAAVYVDVDDDRAAKIVLVDNRASDLASYDTADLLDLLESLPDLEATGWTDHDIVQLQAALEAALAFADHKPKARNIAYKDHIKAHVGRIGLFIPTEKWDDYNAMLESRFPDNKPGIIAWMRHQLGWTVDGHQLRQPQRKVRPKLKGDAKVEHQALEGTKVAISSLNHPDENARQGDIGVIAESLLENGQYSPVVVNRPTMDILAGNHTVAAARSLGWKHIAVTFVEVDDEEARRLILVDNRAADAAGYDEETLARMLHNVSDWTGTGFDQDDADALLLGYGLSRDDLHTPPESRPADKRANANAFIGPYHFNTQMEFYEEWEYRLRQEVGHEPHEQVKWVIKALQLPEGTIPRKMLGLKGHKTREMAQAGQEETGE